MYHFLPFFFFGYKFLASQPILQKSHPAGALPHGRVIIFRNSAPR
jgi:hypothetical protein